MPQAARPSGKTSEEGRGSNLEMRTQVVCANRHEIPSRQSDATGAVQHEGCWFLQKGLTRCAVIASALGDQAGVLGAIRTVKTRVEGSCYDHVEETNKTGWCTFEASARHASCPELKGTCVRRRHRARRPDYGSAGSRRRVH